MSYLASLFEGITKTAAPVRVTPQALEKVKSHFEAQDKDWKSFEKNLRSPAFRSAVVKAQEADPVLKKYVKTFGEYQGSKNVLAQIKSADSGRTYTVKDIGNRWGCNCGNWQFKHSIHGGDCKHIKSVKKSGLVKQSNMKALSVGALVANRLKKSDELRKKHEGLVERVHREIGYHRPPEPSTFSGLLGPL